MFLGVREFPEHLAAQDCLVTVALALQQASSLNQKARSWWRASSPLRKRPLLRDRPLRPLCLSPLPYPHGPRTARQHVRFATSRKRSPFHRDNIPDLSIVCFFVLWTTLDSIPCARFIAFWFKPIPILAASEHMRMLRRDKTPDVLMVRAVGRERFSPS